MKLTTFFVAIVAALLTSGCAETEAEQRERLERMHDEVQVLPLEQMTERIGQLDEDDRAVFAQITEERMAAARAQLAEGSALTRRLIDYSAMDQGRADRLVTECETELGISSIGPDAGQVAECVDQRW